MQSTFLRVFLLGSTIQVNAETYRPSAAAKEQTCRGQTSGETASDRERTLLSRKNSLVDVHVQETNSTGFKGISNIKVIEGKDEKCPNGYDMVTGPLFQRSPALNGDLNQGCGSRTPYLWLCVHKTDDDITHYVTSLKIVTSGENPPKCWLLNPDAFFRWTPIVAQHPANGDLNQGAGGLWVYLCNQKASKYAYNRPLLTDLELSQEGCREGYQLVDFEPGRTDEEKFIQASNRCRRIFLCAKWLLS